MYVYAAWDSTVCLSMEELNLMLSETQTAAACL